MISISKITLLKPNDFHLHLRQGDALKNYTKVCEPYFKKVVIMPNTLPPLTSIDSILKYKEDVLKASPSLEPLMTFKIIPSLTPEDIESFHSINVIGGKLYPCGVTTNSNDGVKNIKDIAHILKVMEEKNIVLNIHAEDPESFSLDREKNYLTQIQWVIDHFPQLKIVIEHISDKETVEFVKKCPSNVAATITVHHLLWTLDDVIGDKINPHHFCKPIAKRPEDLKAIQLSALSNNPKFFLGTDSAPHKKLDKECAHGCAGIFSSPVAIPILASIFEKANKLNQLENFTSTFGCDFYGLPQNNETITLRKENWTVPKEMFGIVPLLAGDTLTWKKL